MIIFLNCIITFPQVVVLLDIRFFASHKNFWTKIGKKIPDVNMVILVTESPQIKSESVYGKWRVNSNCI